VEHSDGVQFPAVDGERSTSAAGRAILTDALRAAGRPPAGDDDWRAAYLDVLRDLTEHDAPGVAAAGLASVHAHLVQVRDGRERPLAEALATTSTRTLPTTEIRGESRRVRELTVPYDGEVLRGDALRRRVASWVADGVVEPGFAVGVEDVLEHPEWLALEGRRVVLLGAGAEMGPLEQLAAWGADVVAVDLPSQSQRVQALARTGAGTVRTPGDGADLLTTLPELRAWIGEHDDGRDLVVASHVYADGGAHVRLAAAADALVADLPGASYAALATPTDCYVAPDDAVREARRRWESRGAVRLLQAPLRAASAGRLLRPAYDGGRRLADGLVRQQGPNYALAKRIQRWRATQAAADGRTVSLNLAPATATRSVTRHRALMAAYLGARHFGVEVFAPATTRALMAALLVRDLHVPPTAAEDALANSAAHGGLWRIPYELRSALQLAALAGFPRSLLGHR